MTGKTYENTTSMNLANQHLTVPLTVLDGLKAAIPIALGYLPIAVAFGLLAKSAGIPNYVAMMMSLTIFAGASQFVGVTMMASGVSPWEIVFTTLIINLRHLLMAASISRRIELGHAKWLPLLAFGITDETFSVASFRSEPRISQRFALALNFLSFGAWNVGTWVGLFAAKGLPEIIKNGMGIALYAMFIGLLVPNLKKSKAALTVALTAAFVHWALYEIPLVSDLTAGWKIILSTLAAAGAGTAFFPGGDGDDQ